MLKTMKVLLLAGVLGGLAAAPTLAQNRGAGGGGGSAQISGGGMGGGGMRGGGGAIYPRMGGGGRSFSGSGRSFGGGVTYMRRGGDFSRQGMGMESRRMRALARPGGGDFPRERFRRGDRPDRFVRDNDFRRFDRKRFDRRHGRFDDDDGRRHKRFRHRTGAFVFFNNGWWYDEPWWTYDTAYVGADYGDAHVQWCINHYRSYNPANNTFVSYGGDIRECVSPYGP
jgi:BA14K-like protein